jgi:hypothetical protein
MKNHEKSTNVFLESPLQFPQPNKLMVVSPSTWASWNFRIKMLSVAEIEKP